MNAREHRRIEGALQLVERRAHEIAAAATDHGGIHVVRFDVIHRLDRNDHVALMYTRHEMRDEGAAPAHPSANPLEGDVEPTLDERLREIVHGVDVKRGNGE